jgi:phosphonopyruvate decarboxylase
MINRYEAITKIVKHVRPNDLVITTTGMISRELFAIADRPANFYMLGSMGLASALGLGLALLVKQRRVLVLEGDGSALMSLGTLPLIAAEGPENLVHVILDNEAYESTGAQASISSKFSLADLSKAAGYAHVVRTDNADDLASVVNEWDTRSGPHLALIKVTIGPSQSIPRVSHTTDEIKRRFLNCVSATALTRSVVSKTE